MNADDIVTKLVSLNDGEIVDQSRLHKEAYLLQKCGARFDIPFIYHHYGPYSPALAEGWIEAKAGNRIEVERKFGSHGVGYLIFRLVDDDVDATKYVGALTTDHARDLVEKMSGVSATILELAAAIVYLRDEEGYGNDVLNEVKVRKPHKATHNRLVGANDLLHRLGLNESDKDAPVETTI